MKRLLLGFLFVLATFAFFAGPSLRTAYATITGRQVDITLPPGDLHPAMQALNFLLKPPVAQGYGKEMKLWATYYHMPTVYSAKVDPKTAKPLLGRNGKAISPPLNLVDWCDAAMQGSIWVDDGGDEPTAYMYVDSTAPNRMSATGISASCRTASRLPPSARASSPSTIRRRATCAPSR